MQLHSDNLFLSKKVSGYSTAEYMLVIQLPDELSQKIMAVKNSFADAYAHRMAAGLPRLTLLKFLQLEVAESRIVKRFQSICEAQAPFMLEVKDFGHFPTHSIYFNIATKTPLLSLVTALKEAQPLLRYDANFKPFFITEPHIALAQQLLPWQYEKAWNAYSHASFSGRCTATKMVLLKRQIGHKAYKVAAEFSFQNLPQTNAQGSLFQ